MITGQLELMELAERCVRESTGSRPERKWLEELCRRFMEKYGIESKSALDERLCEQIYNEKPTPSGILKIRYWRTGQHMPSTREECRRFGQSLELNSDEQQHLMKSYFDRSDEVWTRAEAAKYRKECLANEASGRASINTMPGGSPAQDDTQPGKYRRRMALLQELSLEYLERVHPSRMLQAGISPDHVQESLRHLYYTDSLDYVCLDHDSHTLDRQRTESSSFDPEFRRIMRLEGEIPRRTMLRHLILLMNPFLDCELLSDHLTVLGYCPLEMEHTGVHGERIDAFVIGLLDLYSRTCTGWDVLRCTEWFREACRLADQYFLERGQTKLRFMYFKAQAQKNMR